MLSSGHLGVELRIPDFQVVIDSVGPHLPLREDLRARLSHPSVVPVLIE